MSKYEWEQGEITIPKSQWASFRTGLIRAWNDKALADFAFVKKAHADAKAAAKGLRGSKRDAAVYASLAKSAGGRIANGEFEATYMDYRNSFGWGAVPKVRDAAAHDRFEMLIERLLDGCDRYSWNVCGTLVKNQPQKKSFTTKPLSKSATFNHGDAHISLNNENNIVVWHVSENNHACERAHDWWFAKELFKALGRVKWTRNSGGQIVGNDEYNQESCEFGMGGNYLVQGFGPWG